MKANVNKDKCIGCGNCVALTESQVFDFNDEGLAECIMDEITDDYEDLTKDDIEVLQDMIMIATNDAIKNVDQAMEKAMGQYGSALNGLF